MHSPETIERDRHFAKVKQQLHDVFRDIDKNRDEQITKDELLNYLLTLTSNQNVADDGSLRERLDNIVSTLFERMDANDD